MKKINIKKKELVKYVEQGLIFRDNPEPPDHLHY